MHHSDMLSSGQHINNCSVEILYWMHVYFPYLKKNPDTRSCKFPSFLQYSPSNGGTVSAKVVMLTGSNRFAYRVFVNFALVNVCTCNYRL